MIKLKIQFFLLTYLVYFILMYLLFCIASYSSIFDKIVLKLVNSSYQSGKYSSVVDSKSQRTYSVSMPVYFEMIYSLNIKKSCPSDNSMIIASKSIQYCYEFHEFLSQRLTLLGCEGVICKEGLRIPIINKTLKPGTVENMILFSINHHDILSPFLAVPSSHISRSDHRNLFIATYAVVFVLEVLLQISLRHALVSKASISVLLFMVVSPLVLIAKKISLLFFAKVIALNRAYRLRVGSGEQDSTSTVLLWYHY